MARKTKAEAEETRLAILDAAEVMFFEHGVAQTSLQQVADAAGVTRGAVYFHFKDKVDLFKALHERARLPQEDIVEQAAVDGHPDPLGFIEQISLDCLKILATDIRRQRISAILLFRCEYVGEMADALKRQHDADKLMRANLLRMFAMAHKDNSLAAGWTAATAAKTFDAMIRGLWADWLRFGQSFDLMTEGTECITALFRTFRAH
ncbi:transcriptional regulator [Afipia sp. P52-10]|jgi:AcrR family transcriptional regulator|uniref:TetR family transcriptional regulator n=1 Tax=Afipia sp. P52-10 TaxID=1429916 RepID=UPI0003DF0786|nr:TetR family transcriptional regulator [Afipia sp. P52-10]ETR76748.1 transcriptional regulator [Afipia sp. P52-10]